MRITTFPFGTLLSTVNFKKEEKDQWVRKPRQKFRRIVVGDGLVQTISKFKYRGHQSMF